MSWKIEYTVLPADPQDRRDAPDAHEVRLMNGEKPIRTVGVWESERVATQIAASLNQWAGVQVR